jgi:hypothetical protein
MKTKCNYPFDNYTMKIIRQKINIFFSIIPASKSTLTLTENSPLSFRFLLWILWLFKENENAKKNLRSKSIHNNKIINKTHKHRVIAGHS